MTAIFRPHEFASVSPRAVDDVVIVGGGLAGLFCALKLAPRPVTVISPVPIGEGASSAWAQGGIAAAVHEGDTTEAHARDTIAAGAGLVDEAVARAMTREAPARVAELLAYGVPFDEDLEGHLTVSREAAHSARRIVHVKGDAAGRAIMAALVAAVRKTPSITVREGLRADELFTTDDHVIGVRVRGASGETTDHAVCTVVLATGGIGSLYAMTTNPPQAFGGGLAMAARAGAMLADTEFMQFHPTAIAVGRDPAPLATEALRGEGAILLNNTGEPFMRSVHAQSDLAPRDVVARGVFAEIAASRGVFLDARMIDNFATRFPTVHAACAEAGIDPARNLIPIAPAAHYHMGGVAVDARGRTSLGGLWAAGEVASSGAHGANRLASNSLLEAVVLAGHIAEDIAGREIQLAGSPRPLQAPATNVVSAPNEHVQELRQLMTTKVGVIRDADSLAEALDSITNIECTASSPVLHNAATAALLVAAAAWRRHESRGAHFRSDYPSADPALARRTFLTLADARAIAEQACDYDSRALAAAG